MEDNTVRSSNYWKSFSSLAAAYGLLFLYFIFLPIAFRYKQFTIPRGLAILTAGMCAFSSVKVMNLGTMKEIFLGLPYATVWALVVGMGLILLTGWMGSTYLRRLIKANRLKG